MIDPDDAPAPALADRFTLRVATGVPAVIGTLATGGVREHHPVTGGAFRGDGIDGDVIAGSETLLRRPDGVGVMEVNLIVRMRDGSNVRAIGTGYRTEDGPFVGTRLTIVFEADEDGPHAALSTRAYFAERAGDSDAYVVAEIL